MTSGEIVQDEEMGMQMLDFGMDDDITEDR